MDYLPAGARDAGAVLARSRSRVRLPLRARPRLPQGHARAAAAARRRASGRGRRLRPPRLHRQRAGARGRARGEGRARLARQAHAAAVARRAARGSSWARSTPTCRCPSTPPVSDALRHLHALPRHLSDRRDRRARTSSTRGAASRISPSSSRAAFPEPLRPLIGNRDLRLRRLPARVSLEPLRAGRRRSRTSRAQRPRRARRWSSCSRWTEDEFNTRIAGSAIRRIGYERWLRNLAVGSRQRAVDARRRRGAGARARRSVGAGARARRLGARAAAARPARAAADGEAGAGGAAQRDGA